MKRLKYYLSLVSIIFIIFFSAIIVYCQHEELKLQKVTENLYMIGSTIAGNVAFLVTEEGVLCVDAKYFPYQGEKVVEIIRQITDKPIKYLIYTHYHADHTQGTQAFPSSTLIMAHLNTLKQMKEGSVARIEQDRTIYFPRQLKALEEKVEKLKAEQSPELEEAEKELELKRFQINDYERLKLIFPEITFEDKAIIYLGNHKVELLYFGGPAHTNGDILVYFPEEKVIQMGDLLGYPGEEEERIKSLDIWKQLEKMEPAQIKNIVQSMEKSVKILEKSLEMDFEKVIPGHGKITNKNGVYTQTEFFKKLVIEVKKLIK